MRQKKLERKTERKRTSMKEPLAEGIRKKSRKKRNWKAMTDEEIITYAKKVVREDIIRGRKSLRKADSGMYNILRKRKLLTIIFPMKRRNWSSMSDAEIVSYAKTYIKENQIKNRTGLQKIDMGLYLVLRKRKLIDAIIPIKQKQRNWKAMTDEELISNAKKFIEENSIKNRKGLAKADASLYQVLRKRNLLDALIPMKQKYRSWSSMTDEEIIAYAKTFIKENQIKNRKSLIKANISLYQISRRRKLLDIIFADIEETNKVEAIKQVVKAMEDFGGSK